MATKKKTEPVVEEEIKTSEEVIKSEEKTEEIKPKYEVGSIVFVNKEADADLNGFKLFPQYKKYTYTVEAYDAKSDVYSLRRLNLSLKLKESDIVSPEERSDNSLYRKQF